MKLSLTLGFLIIILIVGPDIPSIAKGWLVYKWSRLPDTGLGKIKFYVTSAQQEQIVLYLPTWHFMVTEN